MLRLGRLARACCLVLVAACGDSDNASSTDTSTTDTGTDTATGDTGGGDTAADTAADTAGPMLESASFKFVDPAGFTDTSFVWVRWTPPGGEAVELLSDADGVITLDDIDWSKGRAILIGSRPGMVIRGVVMDEAPSTTNGFVKDADGSWLIFTSPFPGSVDRITVSGTATNMVDGNGHNLSLGTDAPNATADEGLGHTFSIQVPRDTAFNWCAFEWERTNIGAFRNVELTMHQIACDASTGAADDFALTVDFTASALTPKSASGTFALFSDPDSDLDDEGTPTVVVLAHDDFTGLLGFPSKRTIDANGDAEYAATWVEPTWMDSPLTTYRMVSNTEFSQHTVPGVPAGGDPNVSLPVPPSFLAPSSSTPYPAHFGLVWNKPEDGLLTNVLITGNGSVGAAFNLPAGTTEFELPVLPRGIDYFREGGADQVGVRIQVCEFTTDFGFGGNGICERSAVGKTAALAPPPLIGLEVNPFDLTDDDGDAEILGATVCYDGTCVDASDTVHSIGATHLVPRGGPFTLDADADGFYPGRFNRDAADQYQLLGLPMLPTAEVDKALAEAGVTATAGKGAIVVRMGGDPAGVTVSLSPSSGDGPFYRNAQGAFDAAATALSTDQADAVFFNVDPGTVTLTVTAPSNRTCTIPDFAQGTAADATSESVGADRLTWSDLASCVVSN